VSALPRESPCAVLWEPTALWPRPGAFWSGSLDAGECAQLVEKYTGLLGLIAQGEGVSRAAGLRQLAARWPGALREGQLAPRATLEARGRSCLALGPGVRDRWRAAGLAAVPLWAELHRLLGDLARIRAGRLGPAALQGALGERWPASAAWWAAQPWPPDARLARSWLAAIAECDPVDLDALLRKSSDGGAGDGGAGDGGAPTVR